jgi:hypothetical protein
MARNKGGARTAYTPIFAAKMQFIKSFEPDILVLQECPPPLDETAWAWRDAIGVYGFKGYVVEQYPLQETAPRFFLPVRISGKKNFNLMGVWSQPPYVRSVYAGLTYFQAFMQEGDAVILGDFNASYRFEPPKVKETTITFNKLLDKMIMAEFGLVSCYHAHFGENHGLESQPTYFHVDTKPFHIDFCFVPAHWRVEKVQVVSYRSEKDHYAIITDIAED